MSETTTLDELDPIMTRLARESSVSSKRGKERVRTTGKLKNILVAALFKTALITSCSPEIIDYQPVPITTVVPSTPETLKPKIIVNGTPVSEFPHYPQGDEILINPPELEQIGQEHYDAVSDATCIVMFIPVYDGTLKGIIGTGVLTEGGYVLTARHLVKDDAGNSEITDSSALIVIHPSGVIANAGTQIIEDPTGQDIIAIKVDGFSDLPYLPIDTTLPKPGSTILEGTWHRMTSSEALSQSDIFRGIFGGSDPRDVDTVLIRGALDTTPVNSAAPGSSGGPLYNPLTGSVFAINSSQLGHRDEGKEIPQYKSKRVVLDENGNAVVEDLDPINVSTADIPSQELLDLIGVNK